MSTVCPKKILVLILFFIFLLNSNPVFATHKCGNGVCKPGGHDNESCSTCPADCGSCDNSPTSTPAPAPTSPPASNPTPTPQDQTPGQPTSTPAPASSSPSSSDSSSSSSSTPSVTYYPSAAIASFSPNPTRQTSLTFSGTAAITQGTIQLVEYTITDGVSWIPAQPQDGNFNGKDEHFSFTISNLAEGKYIIKVRAKSGAEVLTQEGSYASQTITIAITPPKVSLDKISPNPTRNQTPAITVKAASLLVEISKVEVSIDGKSWQPTKQFGNTFSITLNKLEDGNYPIRARAFDAAGNIGQSDTQTLIAS